MKILLADDHALFRQGMVYLLKDALGAVTLIEADSLDSALDELARDGKIGLALIDLRMPGMAGAASLAAIRAAHPDVKIMVLSALDSRRDVLDALDAGVHGYVTKSAEKAEIKTAIQRVMAGGIYAPPSLADVEPVGDDPPPAPPPAPSPAPDVSRFTPRQRDVLGLLAQGMSNKEIARKLDLAEGTVKIHLAAVFRELGARNRTDAVVRAGKLRL